MSLDNGAEDTVNATKFEVGRYSHLLERVAW